MHDDVEGEVGAENIAADEACRPCLLDRVRDLAQRIGYLTADVDEGVAGPDRIAGDDDALDERMRVRHHDRDVLAGTRL